MFLVVPANTAPQARDTRMSLVASCPLWALAARVHIAGDDSVRQLVYSDGSSALATLSGGADSLNSSEPLNAPNFVTHAGVDMGAMQELIANLSAECTPHKRAWKMYFGRCLKK